MAESILPKKRDGGNTIMSLTFSFLIQVRRPLPCELPASCKGTKAVGLELDIATGKVLNAVQYSVPAALHPDTSMAFERITVSDWPEMFHLASHCSEMTGLGYIGTDFVLDKKHATPKERVQYVVETFG
jgi:hypothetical protein